MAECIFLFPGQGSQSVGMGKELCEAFPAAKQVFDEADEALGMSVSGLCFDGPEDELAITRNTQPAVTTVDLAVHAVLRENGVFPVAVAGHSLGEYAACVAAGVFPVAEAVRLTQIRGRLMQECADEHPGAMVAVIGLDADAVEATCAAVADQSGGVVSVANFNSPTQVVITGEAAPVAEAANRLTEAGAKRCVELPVSGAWHCDLLVPAQEAFAEVLADVAFSDPVLPFFADVDGKRKTSGTEVHRGLVEQITGSVLWTDIIRAMRAERPEAVFVECGPGKVLRGLLRQIDRDAICLNADGPESVEKVLAELGA